MGYMGFGMKKEVYTRKPKKAFSHLKDYYKRELDHRGYNSSIPSLDPSFSESERVALKNKIRNMYRMRLLRIWLAVGLVMLVVIGSLFYLLLLEPLPRHE